MANDSSGPVLIIAALIIGLSMLGSAFMLQSSMDKNSTVVAEMLASIARSASELAQLGPRAPAAPKAPARPARAGRPDPNRVYAIAVGESPTRGPKTAVVKLVEWSDFQWPFCKRVGPTLEQIQKEYGDKVQLVFKHLPLSIHNKALGAHQAAEAANQQGKFWEMHDLIFEFQREMSDAKYIEYAGKIGLDVDRFKKDLKSAKVKSRIDSDTAAAAKLGVTGTPGFFVNGRFLSGAQPFSSFKRLIDEEIKKAG